MKQTKQVKKVAGVVSMVKKFPETTAHDVAVGYNCSKNYAYLLLKKAKEILAQPKPRLQGVQEMNDVKTTFLDSIPLMGETLAMLPPDMVNSPPHYKVGGIETIDYIQAKLTPEEFRGYLKGNVLKYTSRAEYKEDADKDVDKMVWYALKLQSLK